LLELDLDNTMMMVINKVVLEIENRRKLSSRLLILKMLIMFWIESV